ncbi:MAG TPA: hypothetical protein VL051_16525 [Burkholderiaceae bacterium]|nr:hypothetical protein [Burkholderiaceae bacterium]
MTYPGFFDQAPSITVRDELAQLLGAAEGGLMTYHYVDAVRLAGHSCPTVAGAYLLTRRALQLLYAQQIPQRGGIRVQFSAPVEQGVIGVLASVAGLITGAAGQGGFKGIGGRHCRKDLLHYGANFDGEVRFERQDTGAAVQLGMDMGKVPFDPRTLPLLQKALGGSASADEVAEFGRLWQERVRKILLEHVDDPDLIFVTD